MVVSGRSRGRGQTLYIEEKSAYGVAHIVFLGRCAPGLFRKIRNYLFSDLGRGREEFLQHGHKKRVIVAMRGLLRHEQI